MPAHRFLHLLVAQLGFFVVVTVLRELTASADMVSTVSGLVFATLLLVAAYAVSETRRTVVIVFGLAGVTVLLGIAELWWFDSKPLESVTRVAQVGFIGYVVALLLRHLFSSRRVTFDTICAAICVYLFMAVAWSLVYSLVERAAPGSFIVANPDELGRIGERHGIASIYFSFVTLTTLGYGDIVPVSRPAAVLATLEALLGQIYLTVLVARLVALHIAHADPPSSPSSGDDSQGN